MVLKNREKALYQKGGEKKILKEDLCRKLSIIFSPFFLFLLNFSKLPASILLFLDYTP